MTLTKADLVLQLIQRWQLTSTQAKLVVEGFFEEISKSLEKGETVKLSGFGNFDLREKRARPGRNPKTGAPVAVSARRVATFKAGKKLRSRLIASEPQLEMRRAAV